jgi:hypothetical protein
MNAFTFLLATASFIVGGVVVHKSKGDVNSYVSGGIFMMFLEYLLSVFS